MPVALVGQGAQPMTSRQELAQERPNFLADGLRMIVDVKQPAFVSRYDAAGDVNFEHRLERKTFEARVERETAGELMTHQVADVEQQTKAGSGVEPGHEIEHVKWASRREDRGIFEQERN